jgi:hypothetical protein
VLVGAKGCHIAYHFQFSYILESRHFLGKNSADLGKFSIIKQNGDHIHDQRTKLPLKRIFLKK